jgi:hypothetical protein
VPETKHTYAPNVQHGDDFYLVRLLVFIESLNANLSHGSIAQRLNDANLQTSPKRHREPARACVASRKLLGVLGMAKRSLRTTLHELNKQGALALFVGAGVRWVAGFQAGMNSSAV